MRCSKCGNEIADNVKFCGKCGNKLLAEEQKFSFNQPVTGNNPSSGQPAMNYTAVNNGQPNMTYNKSNNNQYNQNYNAENQVAYNQPVAKKSGSGFIKLVILAVFIVACYFGYKEVEKRFLLPIGSWKSADTPIEMNFLEDGELQMGAYGTFAGNMKWKKTSVDNYYISGEVPELLGFSLGEVGCEAHFDWKNKKLTVNFGFGEVTFDKEE